MWGVSQRATTFAVGSDNPVDARRLLASLRLLLTLSSAWHCSRLSSRHAYTSPSCLCAARCSEPARTPCARSTSTQPTPSAAWASTSAARCQLACRSAAWPCLIPHTHAHPHQLSELNVLEEDELDALLAGSTLCGEQPPGGLGQPTLQHAPPAPDSARGGLQPRPASASLGQLAETFWLAGYTGLVFTQA